MKHGWIRQSSNTGKFVIVGGCESTTIKDAYVYPTRKEARTSTVVFKLDVDIVRKVEIDENGKAVKIIPGR